MARIMMIIGTVVVFLLLAAVNAKTYYVGVDKSTGKATWTTALSRLEAEPAAVVDYSRTMLETGWNELNITTNGGRPDLDQAYAAGYGEGVATYDDSWTNYGNSFGGSNATVPDQLTSYLTKNWAWMQQEVAANNQTDDLWYQVGLLMRQTEGLFDGLNAVAPANQTFTWFMVHALNLGGDLLDLFPAFGLTSVSSNFRRQRFSHCSALIKLKYDLSDIFFGHATWSSYNMMLRTYKHYHFNYQRCQTKEISFSGYPGVLVSVDDFYLTDQGLAVIETTLNVDNMSMYVGNIVPESLLYWVRVSVVTRVTSNAKDWVTQFSRYNSGTYNNQWMVLDLKLFTPGQDLLPNTLWIAEQFPGVVGTQDVTPILQYGYWPSYNIPSIPELYVASGNKAAAAQSWHMSDYQKCIRAQIFRRDQANVVDLASFQFIMQYNNYQYDSVELFDPVYAVASRGDLLTGTVFPHVPQCFGAIDAKTSSYSLYQKGRQVVAYSGPTPQQGPFDFATTNATMMCTPRAGLPTLWNFSWQTFQPLA